MEHSVHDNVVLGYAVDAVARTIRLRTEYRDMGAPFKRLDVVFEGVQGYEFRDNLEGILSDVSEVSLDRFGRDYADALEQGGPYAWPGTWNGYGARAHLDSIGARVWYVESAIGFNGFVIATAMTHESPDD